MAVCVGEGFGAEEGGSGCTWGWGRVVWASRGQRFQESDLPEYTTVNPGADLKELLTCSAGPAVGCGGPGGLPRRPQLASCKPAPPHLMRRLSLFHTPEFGFHCPVSITHSLNNHWHTSTNYLPDRSPSVSRLLLHGADNPAEDRI